MHVHARCRIGLLLVLVLVLGVAACSRERSEASAGSTSTSAAPKTPPRTPLQPDGGPCANDAQCTVWLEPCGCGCLAIVGVPPIVAGKEWSTMCNGGPPKNCGAANPCSALKAVCDPGTKTCRTTK